MLRIALLVYKCLVFISLGTCLNYSHVDLFKNIFLKILGMAITKSYLEILEPGYSSLGGAMLKLDHSTSTMITCHCPQTNMHGRKVSRFPQGYI
jgi:hypothetical protein